MTISSGAAPRAASRPLRRRAAASTAALMAGAMIAAGATPASALLTGPGVDAGQNITVFANIDMVAVFGFGPVGTTVTVDVYRGDTKIGTASGPAVDNGDGPGLEVNHGPEGTAQPGDCWIGAAPNIRAGDRIVVTSAGDVDEVTVDDIHYTGGPVADGDDVVVHGVAIRANGTAISAGDLDSAEFRSDSGKYRTAPKVEPRAGVVGGFTLRYSPPYLDPEGRNRDNLSEAQRRSALLNQDGHAIGFGHTEPLPREAMLVDGIVDNPGHAPGCGGTPAEPEEPGTDPFEPGPTPPGPVDPGTPPTTRTLTLNPVADTMARQSSPSTRYGSTSPLKADTRATDSTRSRENSYLKFVIPQLAAGESITGARLGLTVSNGTTNGPAVYRTGTSWSDRNTVMTWNSGQPSRLSGTANGNFGSVGTGKRSTGLSLTGLGSNQTVSFQLYAESSDGLSFSSRESSTTGNRPQLILTIKKG